jgi:TonB family protein
LSAPLFEGSGKRPGWGVLSVRLLSDREDQDNERSVQGQAYVPLKTLRVLPEIKRENLREPVKTAKDGIPSAASLTTEIQNEKGEEEHGIENLSPEGLQDVQDSTGDKLAENSSGNEVDGAVHVQQDGHYAAGIQMDINHYGKGTAPEAGTGDGLFPEDIIGKIRNAIEQSKTYPLIARKRRMEGTVHVGFRITPQGRPEEVRIMKSSGFAVLDRATVDIVERAAPFPYIDASLEVPVVFRLD